MATNKRTSSETGESTRSSAAKRGHWSLGLKSSMEDPLLRVYADEKVVVIKDKYPKARFHYLVLPKENIANLKSLTEKHVGLLNYMDEKGEWIAKKNGGGAKFRFGYHAVPSMSHLHLHVISQDFDSPALKTKKHWNSFTTDYFVDSKRIIENLSKNGKVNVMSSEEGNKLLASPLKCHICSLELPTIPKLKSHLQTHNLN